MRLFLLCSLLFSLTACMTILDTSPSKPQAQTTSTIEKNKIAAKEAKEEYQKLLEQRGSE